MFSRGQKKKNNILIEKDSVLKLNVTCCLKQILRKIKRKIQNTWVRFSRLELSVEAGS